VAYFFGPPSIGVSRTMPAIEELFWLRLLYRVKRDSLEEYVWSSRPNYTEFRLLHFDSTKLTAAVYFDCVQQASLYRLTDFMSNSGFRCM